MCNISKTRNKLNIENIKVLTQRCMPLNLFHNSHNNLETTVQRCLLLLQREMQLKRVCVNKLTDTPGF